MKNLCIVAVSAVLLGAFVASAQEPPKKKPAVPGPMLAQGYVEFQTPEFILKLVKSSQTVAALLPKGANGFDFTPGDILVQRSQNGYYHLGDLDIRLRQAHGTEWKNYSTSTNRAPVVGLPVSGNVLASADLSATLPGDIPLKITRSWLIDGGKLALRYTLTNRTQQPVEIGALGIPMIFNNVLNERTLEQAHGVCSFYDPYIGEDAGYLQVTRLNGHGPALVVVPDGKTPFEAYNPILDERASRRGGPKPIFTDPTPRGMTFEGFYDWMVYSAAYTENEWKAATPWNPGTSVTLAPGESKTFGLRFLLSPSIREIENTLAANHRPVAVGVPGYVVPMDIDARLFIKNDQPVKSMTVEPAGAIDVTENNSVKNGWKAYAVKGHTWGRSRLLITYTDGTTQSIQYFVTKPEVQAVADMGHFLTHEQWFDEANDSFHRNPSSISYDREAHKQVRQDSRVWIAGLSDEAGAGSWLAAAMKEFGQPDKEEVDRLEQFVDGVLWGHLQYSDGPLKYGVRKSLFYYQPDELPAGYYDSRLDWKSWTSWSKKASEATDRSFNYPHVAAAYWTLYRLARNNDGLVTHHPWGWYLDQAYETSMAMVKYGPGYSAFGQMEGDVFLQILLDLRREGRTQQASALEEKMRARADHWKQEAYPFGSEMPWDSTGQEEVYAWTKFFGYQEKAEVTLNAILGYMPTVPHWGYNGSARRFWDFLYGGKYPRLERQLHHYGSGINAIPVLSEYRDHPDDLYLLRVGYGGTMGATTNIDQSGATSAAFHGFPDMLKFDPYSGDYGPNFFGHALNAATYVVNDPNFGWISFGGNVSSSGNTIKATPLDSFRTRLYIAPLGLWLTLDAGKFQNVEFEPSTGKVSVALAPATKFTSTARLRVEEPANIAGVGPYRVGGGIKEERGAYVVPLGASETWVELGH